MVSEGEINGHPALWLENEYLRVSVLPEKGADVYELIYKPRGVDFLLKTPGGLRPPGAKKAKDFLENYEGGWQELFPNPGDAVAYRGKELPFHGIAALLPWQLGEVCEDDDTVSISLYLDFHTLPFRLERQMSLLPGRPTLEIRGTITNRADTAQEFLWGHHIVLGSGFLTASCRMEMPSCKIYTPEVVYEPETASLAPRQCELWPFASSLTRRDRVDLRNIPGPAAHTHDDIYLSDLREGWLDVFNPDLDLHFRLEWDPSVFGCIVNWRPLGGADMPPLTGIYGMGIEPWVSRFNLTEAIRQKAALSLDPGESLATTFRAKILDESLNHD
jgi:Domain of unknown function (DUF4432)